MLSDTKIKLKDVILFFSEIEGIQWTKKNVQRFLIELLNDTQFKKKLKYLSY